jgi:hypothetical protein
VIYLSATNSDNLSPSTLFSPVIDAVKKNMASSEDPIVISLFFNSLAHLMGHIVRPNSDASEPMPLPEYSTAEVADRSIQQATTLFHQIMGDSSLPLFQATEMQETDS